MQIVHEDFPCNATVAADCACARAGIADAHGVLGGHAV